jgi:hypothetical protein
MPVVLTGICSMMVAWLAMGFGVWSIAGVVIGAVLLDCGLRAAMVANQTLRQFGGAGFTLARQHTVRIACVDRKRRGSISDQLDVRAISAGLPCAALR